MSNNNLNRNVPGYNGNYDPDSSSDKPKPTVSRTEEKPYVSIYGMVNARNLHEDVEMYRSTLFNLKTDPDANKARQLGLSNFEFLQQYYNLTNKEIEKLDEIDKPINASQPEKTITKVKSEPLDEIEENLSIEEETEPLEYLPEIYSESTENPRANELEINRMFLQQYRESEEMAEINIPSVEMQPLVDIHEIKIEPEDEIEENFESYEEETEPLEYPPEIYLGSTEIPISNENRNYNVLFQQDRPQPQEMDDDINIEQPEENPPLIDPTSPRANELEDIFFQQYTQPEEIYEINIDQMEQEPEEMDDMNIDQTEQEPTPSPIDTTTNPRANELESNRMIIQEYRQPEETPSPIDTTTNPRANELESNRLIIQQDRQPDETDETNIQQGEQDSEETPSPINTTTNRRANELDNGNTNIIENPADVPKKSRKKKEVNSTPTRVSTRIKKPRIMYNV